ncbi:MAG: electron transfer flavoprotein subunit beta/FixA family protein [Oscillibacter sp.]|nr:electron transfer flavoprotein subunit beta/FixA family protein [Oscillibacter sp.]
MKILVCTKLVPDTSESDVSIDKTGKDIATNGLKFDINEADNYAVEEAILTREAKEGEVDVLCMAPQSADVVIRMALAKGCERALRIEDPRVNVRNPLQAAKVLAAAAKDQAYDLIFTGCMSSDDKNMSVGAALAEELGMNHAAMVKHVEIGDGKVTVQRELEGGLLEVSEVALPAVLSVQTGINTPRYAPVRELRKAMKKELKVVNLDDIGVDENQVNEAGSKVELLKLYYPEVISNAEMIEGTPEEKAEQIAFKLVKGGLL